MNQSNMNTFISLSAVLTGFSKEIIAPQIDPIDIKSDYLKKFQSELGQTLVDKIFQTYEQLEKKKLAPEEIGAAILDIKNGTEFILACRSLIFLWYSGAWPSIGKNGVESEILSSKSYNAGLVWKVMQSHPMGNSNYRYGYWSTKPDPLNEYTGNN